MFTVIIPNSSKTNPPDPVDVTITVLDKYKIDHAFNTEFYVVGKDGKVLQLIASSGPANVILYSLAESGQNVTYSCIRPDTATIYSCSNVGGQGK